VRVIIRTERVDGSTTELTFAGFDARVALHELDHLDGRCFVGDAWRAQRDRAARTPAA
jgi:peptide deformylase